MNDEIETQIYDVIWDHVLELPMHSLTETNRLMPKLLWESFSVDYRRYIGELVAQWQMEGRLPLERVGFTKQRHNRYRRI